MVNEPHVRWYTATNQANEDVLIQEYLLPDTEFHPTEIQHRQKAFERLVNLNSHSLNGPGEGRDFRLLRLVEAFSPSSEGTAQCYLVAKPLTGISLKQHLNQHGYFKSTDIREVLRQVLQTLQFLHSGCRIQFSVSQTERGIPHGNLSLDSLFIRQTDLVGVNSDRQFFIHVTDLMLWRHLFYPHSSPKFRAIAQTADNLGSTIDDLRDLGRIGFELAGCAIAPNTNDIIGLLDESAQEKLKDEHLYHFLCRLIGEETPFKTAGEALQTLWELPKESPTLSQEFRTFEKNGLSQRFALLGLPIAACVLLLTGAIALLWLRNSSTGFIVSDISAPSQTQLPPEKLYIAKVLPPERLINYQVESDGALFSAMFRTLVHPDPDLQAQSLLLENSRTSLPLMDEIERRHPQFQWFASSQPRFYPRLKVLRFVEESPRNVGFIRNPGTLENIEVHPIAYDGLTVLVPFRDVHNQSENVPKKLEGYISIEDLRTIYTSDDLDTVELREFPVHLYFPNESNDTNRDAIQLFKELVLKSNEDAIRKFDALQEQAQERDRELIRENGLNKNLYETMFFSHEASNQSDESISIGFDLLSRSFGQCTVYPLAIGANVQSGVQSTYTSTGAIQPDVDLCGIKGSYFVQLPDDYPLRYELALVYQQDSSDGEALKNIFLTQEAQYLMSEVGLVPIVPMQELWSFMWGQTFSEDANNN